MKPTLVEEEASSENVPRMERVDASRLETFDRLHVFYKKRMEQSALVSIFISYMKGQEYHSFGFSLTSSQGVKKTNERAVLEEQYPTNRRDMTHQEWKAFIKEKQRGIKKHLFLFQMAATHGMDVLFFRSPRKRAPNVWKQDFSLPVCKELIQLGEKLGPQSFLWDEIVDQI